jgi:hypothetical protein
LFAVGLRYDKVVGRSAEPGGTLLPVAGLFFAADIISQLKEMFGTRQKHGSVGRGL